VTIFDRKLFKAIRADDLIWSLEDTELHLTITKAERNKMWDQLGEEAAIKKDKQGNVIPETLPESASAADRMNKFRQMVTGDDGEYVSYEDLDPAGRKLVDASRKYEQAMASGDKKKQAESAMELEELGRFVI